MSQIGLEKDCGRDLSSCVGGWSRIRASRTRSPLEKRRTLNSIAIIGAVCSGLAAAHILQDSGRVVTVFERSSEVGGRAATRQRQGFIYDHGAQYIKGASAVSSALITGRFRATRSEEHTSELQS